MDRAIVYTSALPRTTDFLNANKFSMMGLAYAMQGVLGNTPNTPPPPYVHGLIAAPTSPATLQITIGVGGIYASDPVDATAYSDLGTDSHNIVKQGILNDPVTLTITPPGTPGYSQIYLVEAILADSDTGSTVLPYYNSANPAAPYSGPGNNGTSQYTIRSCQCAVTLKAGAAAPTGTQTAPTPDLGYVALYQVTVTYGQTQITLANIAQDPHAPFFPTLPSMPSHIQNGDWISADDTGNANAVVITPVPAIAGLQKYQKFRFKVKNSNTGPSTFTVNGFSGSLYIGGQATSAFPANALQANVIAECICDGINFELTAAQFTINNNSYTTGGPTTGLVNVQVFTNSGTYLPTAGATKALVFATGGGASGANTCPGGGGGGAGETRIGLFSLSGVASEAITIGAGGAGVGVNTVGNPGGNTSFGALMTAMGGTPTNTTSGQGGLGGSGGSGGLVGIPGGDGYGTEVYNYSGHGGASFWGGGGRDGGVSFSGAIMSGRAPGSGGAGGLGGAWTGLTGASGMIVILEF